MYWQYTPYTIPLVLSAAIAAGLALFGWRNRSTPGDVPFAGLMLGVAFWSICYAAGLSVVDLSIKIFWTNLMYLGITAVPGCWLAFTLLHTEQKESFPKWLLIEPIVTVLMAWTNPFHKLLHTALFFSACCLFRLRPF